MANLKVATFNVENLFERPKVFNFKDHSIGDQILGEINKLNDLFKKTNYTAAVKNDILTLYHNLKDYIIIREDRGKLFKKQGWSVIGVKANGSGDWDGAINYKKAKFSEMARQNTATVIKKVNAHIACVVEADNRISLKAFDANLLNYKYKYEMLIDGNDQRGIDVGILSKYPFGALYTHIYDKVGSKRVFSRDCLEAEIKLSDNKSLYILCNHFKSKGYDADGTAAEKRERQARRVAKYLSNYNLDTDYVVVAGDLNDTPGSDPLKPLLNTPGLYDVLELQFPNDPAKRWTYLYKKFEQIDFLLVSEALKKKFVKAGVERRGIYNLRKVTTDSYGKVEIEEQFDTVTHWTNAASDHAAVWATFDVL